MRTRAAARGNPTALFLVAGAAAAYYAIFIWKTSFVIGGTRYFSLFEDAMVSMRYARNLVRGYGLVWNPGEPPVEGFTNPLWTMVMAAVHLLPLPAHVMSLVVQAIGAVILVALLIVVHRIAEQLADDGALGDAKGRPRAPGRKDVQRRTVRPFAIVAVILVAFYYPLVNWTLQGMEVGLLALIAATAAGMLLSGRSPAAIYALLAIGTFVRMDFVVTLGSFAVCGAILEPQRRARHLLVALIAAILALGLQTLARAIYFHDIVPNTYYLKLTGYPLGLRVIRGAWVLLRSFTHSLGLLLFLPLAAVRLARPQLRGRLAALLVPFAGQCAYSVWVGGDAWEDAIACNRYLAVAVPLALLVSATGLAAVAQWLDRHDRYGPVPIAALTMVAVLGMAPYRATMFLEPPPYIDANRELTTLGLAAQQITLPGARVAVAAAGAIGYYSDRQIVDLLGKSDRHIARIPMWQATYQNPLTYFYPGHLKWDYAYSIGQLRPDIVTQLWEYADQAEPYLRDYVRAEVDVDHTKVLLMARRGSALVRR